MSMRFAASCALVLGWALCLQPLCAAEKNEENAHSQIAEEKTQRRVSGAEEKAPIASSVKPALVEKRDSEVSSTAPKPSESNSRAQADEQKPPEKEAKKDTGDPTFASIQNTGLTVADGNRWYYESFDRQGRQAFAVLYEDGRALEQIVWTYQDTARYPAKKQIFREKTSDTIFYDEAGRELVIEQYKGKRLTSKTENVYNSGGKLTEQTVTAGKNTDKSVWDIVKDKAVSQTKYRNGKKTAFIELHTEPHIVHLYVDDKEVFVGEEQ